MPRKARFARSDWPGAATPACACAERSGRGVGSCVRRKAAPAWGRQSQDGGGHTRPVGRVCAAGGDGSAARPTDAAAALARPRPLFAVATSASPRHGFSRWPRRCGAQQRPGLPDQAVDPRERPGHRRAHLLEPGESGRAPGGRQAPPRPLGVRTEGPRGRQRPRPPRRLGPRRVPLGGDGDGGEEGGPLPPGCSPSDSCGGASALRRAPGVWSAAGLGSRARGRGSGAGSENGPPPRVSVPVPAPRCLAAVLFTRVVRACWPRPPRPGRTGGRVCRRT